MSRTWANGGPPFLNADNLNALEADVTTALGVPDAALAGRVVAGATATALNATYVNKPPGVMDGQVPVWQASTSTWVPGTPAGASNLDGGSATSVYTGTFNFDGGSAT